MTECISKWQSNHFVVASSSIFGQGGGSRLGEQSRDFHTKGQNDKMPKIEEPLMKQVQNLAQLVS